MKQEALAMKRRFDSILAIPLAALLFSSFGCSQKLPTSADGPDARATSGGIAVDSAIRPDPAGTFTFILPEASGSIRRMPELRVFDGGGVRGDIYSSYFRTTADNREFRRGFAEFSIPNLENVFSARVVLRETRGGSAYPAPPDRHELSAYSDVDGVVSTRDYDRPTSPIGTFETDANLAQGTFELDVTRLVTASRGARLGFRLKMESDPTETAMRGMGTYFGRSTTPCAFRIEMRTTPPEANDLLQDMIVRLMDLPPRVEAGLLDPLRQVGEILADGDPANDGEACERVQLFLDRVAGAGEALMSYESWDLNELGTGLMAGLGCGGNRGDAQIIVYRDWPSFEAGTARLAEIDFETPNFERDGVSFRDPNGRRSGFCSAPTCRPDPDNPDGGNIQLFLNPGSTIGFPANTNAAMLIVEGIGDNPFQVRVTDAAGGATVVDGTGVYFGVTYLGFTSRVGISRIEIVDVGGTRGPLALSAVRFGVGPNRANRRHPVSTARS
jgi:hypothetical protein